MQNKQTSTKTILFFVLFTYLLFNNGLENIFPFLKQFYLDEVIVASMVVLLFATQIKNKKELFMIEYLIIWLYLLVVLIGIVGNVLFQFQSYSIAALDAILLSKFIIGYFFGRIYFTKDSLDEIVDPLHRYVKIVISLLFFTLVMNIFFSIWPSYEYRFGFPIQHLFFSHSTYLASVAVVCLIIFFLQYKKFDIFFIVMSSVLIIAAGRNKGLIFLGIYFLVLLFLFILQKVNLGILFFSGSILILFFQNTIFERLLSSETSARYLLYSKSFEAAMHYFPLGGGFGTFGSKASLITYSSLYSELGLEKVHGFTEENGSYLMDSFFAMIVGQFGFIGFGLILIIFSLFLVMIKKKNVFLEFNLLLFSYVILSMITENFISSTFGIMAFLFFGIMIGTNKKKIKRTGEDMCMEETLSMRILTEILRKKFKVIILSMLTSVFIGAGMNYFFITPEYKSTVQVIATQDVDSKILQNTEVQANIQLVNTYSEIIKSPYILEKVANEIDGLYSVPELAEMIEVKNETDSQVINISILAKDKKVAERIVTFVAEKFRKYSPDVLKSGQITILSKSEYNTFSTRKTPFFYLAISVVLGLFFGITLALLLSVIDTTIKIEEDIFNELEIPFLGSIGSIQKQSKSSSSKRGKSNGKIKK